MIKIDNICANGWMNAIRGMRNSHRSWDKMDSKFVETDGKLELGPNDLELAQRLAVAGGPHAKFRRMIHVSMDILAPLYWWKEFDTYKIGTVANSDSTMYNITKKEFEVGDFSFEKLAGDSHIKNVAEALMVVLNGLRDDYLDPANGDFITKKNTWYQIIQLLPSSYNQLRTVDLNYEVLNKIYVYRHDHKLDEWRKFCDLIADQLPYAKQLILPAKLEESK